MNEIEYKDLAKRADEAIRLFRQIQALKHVADTLGHVTEKPVHGITRIQFEIEFKTEGGMFQRQMFSFGVGELFFERTAKEFVQMVKGVRAEALEKFSKL